MRILRFIIILAVIGYAGWLAWPFVQPLIDSGSASDAAARSAQAVESGGTPVALLWIAAVVLYLLAAGLLGSGNPKAAMAYFLGFIADAALRLAIDRTGRGGPATMSASDASPGDIAARSAEVVAPAGSSIDPTWFVLGGLILVGLIIVWLVRRPRRRALHA